MIFIYQKIIIISFINNSFIKVMFSNIFNFSIKVVLWDMEKLVFRKGFIIWVIVEVCIWYFMVKFIQGMGNRCYIKVKMLLLLFCLVLVFLVILDGLILGLDIMLDLDMDCYQLVLDMVIVFYNMDMVFWVF